jgi:hypothetical protein
MDKSRPQADDRDVPPVVKSVLHKPKYLDINQIIPIIEGRPPVMRSQDLCRLLFEVVLVRDSGIFHSFCNLDEELSSNFFFFDKTLLEVATMMAHGMVHVHNEVINADQKPSKMRFSRGRNWNLKQI